MAQGCQVSMCALMSVRMCTKNICDSSVRDIFLCPFVQHGFEREKKNIAWEEAVGYVVSNRGVKG